MREKGGPTTPVCVCMCVYVCDQPIYFFKSDLWIKYTQTCIQTVDIFLLVWVEDLIPEKKYLLNNTHAYIDGICVWGKKTFPFPSYR